MVETLQSCRNSAPNRAWGAYSALPDLVGKGNPTPTLGLWLRFSSVCGWAHAEGLASPSTVLFFLDCFGDYR